MTDDFNLTPRETADAITTSLIRRAQNNDAPAWEKLAYAYTPLVYFWCRTRLPRAGDAENVAGEVFLAVARDIKTLKGGGRAFRAFIRRITHRRIADFWRLRERQIDARGGSDARRELEQVAADQSIQAESHKVNDELTEEETCLVLPGLVESIRDEFKPRTWKAFYAVAIDRREPIDVAEELGMSRNAVFVAKSRILRRLREIYGDVAPDDSC